MPWVVREAVRDINRAVGRRWHAVDPLLPDPATMRALAPPELAPPPPQPANGTPQSTRLIATV